MTKMTKSKAPKQYIITRICRFSGKRYSSKPVTLNEAIEYFRYTLLCGVSWQHYKGCKKINQNPRSIKSLITNLNNASRNASKNGCGDCYFVEE